jgi:Na+/pantothenate symporter
MVIMAWSGLASAFAPLLVFLCLGQRPSQVTSIIAILAGFTVSLSWRLLGLHEVVYEGLPGIVFGLCVLWAAQFRLKSE